MRVSQHCFAVTGLAYLPPWAVNAGFVAGEHTTLIVDTGANALAAATIAGYAALARESNRIIALNTERHFDHIGGNGYLRSRGIDIFGHPEHARTEQEFRAEIAEFNAAIADPARRDAHEADCFYAGTTLANANRLFTGEETFDLGGVEVLVFPTPGHTPSNLSAYVPADAVLYCGDCVLSGYQPNLAGGGAAEWWQWLESLERIASLSLTAVVPGHGPVIVGDEIPAAIERMRQALETALASAGCDIDPASLEVVLDEQIPSRRDAVEGVLHRLVATIAQMPCAEGQVQQIELALAEALANAIVHGNRERPEKLVHVWAACIAREQFVIAVTDEGEGFDYASIPDPTMAEHIFSAHGRGIYLMNRLMETEHHLGGRRVVLRKRIAK